MAALPLVVTYEDRTSALPGVELLARSLARHAPTMRLRVYSPLPEVAALAEQIPGMEAVHTDALKGRGWNVKPTVLGWALDDVEAALWLDTDIVIAGDLAALAAGWPDEALVVGQEFRGNKERGGSLRAEGWGLPVGRLLPYHVNSGSVRALRKHRALLGEWSRLLADPAYVAIQKTHDRPIHALGDQDVLWALLVSETFSDLSVHYIKPGSEMILHCGGNGYHVVERLGHVFGAKVAFVHMLGGYKPWSFTDVPDRVTAADRYLHMACFELSPFHAASRPYAAALGNPPWLERRTGLARTLNALALGNVALRGLPLAMMAWFKDARAQRKVPKADRPA